MIVDSSILIDHLAGVRLERDFIESLNPDNRPLTHFVVAAEVIAGVGNRAELRAAQNLLDRFQVLPSIDADATASLDLLRTHRLRDGVGWPDCLIAATCLRLGLPIATRNTKHFRVFRGLRVMRPY